MYVKTGQNNMAAFRVTELKLNLEQATKLQIGRKYRAIQSLE
jgi:hypothetical protein